MARFRYVALDRAGKSVSGEVAAEDADEVKRRLRDMGCFPSRIDQAAALSIGRSQRARRKGKVTASDVVVFTRQLADMTAASLPMFRSLTVLLEQATQPALREMVEAIRTDVQEGLPLSQALQRHPRHFPDLYVNMVRAGETSGHLEAVLMRLAEFLQKSHQRRAQVVSALMYPAVLITVAIGAVAFVIGYLIPKLDVLFEELEQTLPLITQVLLATAGVISKTWWLAALFIITAVVVGRSYARTEGGRETLDILLLRAPLLGPVWHKMAVSRLARTSGTMLAGGVPILTSLEISGNAVGNRPLSRAAEMAREEVRQGARLAGALEQTGVFPPLLVHMAAVGEEMLIRVADSLDFEVDSTLGRLTTLLEPFVIIVMGVIVGGIVAAVLLPIFQINATIGG